MRRRILVTGASGFIGSHVCERFVKNGDFVVGMSRHSTENIYSLSGIDRFWFVNGDVNNKSDIEQALKCFREPPDTVIHLAGQLLRDSGSASNFIQVNTLGLQQVIDTCGANGVKKFVFASTSSVYDAEGQVPSCEQDCNCPCDYPDTPYAASKRGGELLGVAAVKSYGIDFTSLRFFTVYGPRQRLNQSIAKFTHLISRNQPVVLYDQGSRDYVYITDVVEAIVAAVKNKDKGFKIFNVGTGISTSLDQLVQIVSDCVGRPVQISSDPLQSRFGDSVQCRASIEACNKALGFRSKISLKEGVRLYVNWVRQQDLPNKLVSVF